VFVVGVDLGVQGVERFGQAFEADATVETKLFSEGRGVAEP
jgi:hypothetical protein